MNGQFKPGDVVQLKSGGPKMTIERYDADIQQYYCVWFVGNELQDGLFAPAALNVASEAAGPMIESVPMRRSDRLAGL